MTLWAIRVWCLGQPYHVGACLEAHLIDLFMAASDFSCNFFHILASGFEQRDNIVVQVRWYLVAIEISFASLKILV